MLNVRGSRERIEVTDGRTRRMRPPWNCASTKVLELMWCCKLKKFEQLEPMPYVIGTPNQFMIVIHGPLL